MLSGDLNAAKNGAFCSSLSSDSMALELKLLSDSATFFYLNLD